MVDVENGDILGQQRSVRVNAGRPPSRLGCPRSRESSSEANEDLGDCSTVAHARTSGRRLSSLSPMPSSGRQNSVGLSRDDCTAFSFNNPILSDIQLTELDQIDDEYYAELTRLAQMRRDSRRERAIRGETSRASRHPSTHTTMSSHLTQRNEAFREDYVSAQSSNVPTPRPTSQPMPTTSCGGGAGGRSPAATVAPPSRAAMNYFIRTCRAENEPQPLIDDLRNYEDFGSKALDETLDHPVMSFTPIPVLAPTVSNATELEQVKMQGFENILPRIAASCTIPTLVCMISQTEAAHQSIRNCNSEKYVHANIGILIKDESNSKSTLWKNMHAVATPFFCDGGGKCQILNACDENESRKMHEVNEIEENRNSFVILNLSRRNSKFKFTFSKCRQIYDPGRTALPQQSDPA